MRELAPGLRRWTAWHAEWEEDVGCVAYDAADALVVIDPLVTDWPSLEAIVDDRPVHVLITVYWHARSTREVVERFGARLWVHRPGRAAIARRAGEPTDLFRLADPLPGGIQAFDAGRRNEVLYWIPEHRALAAGDVLLGSPLRLCPESWLPERIGHDELRATLHRLLDLP